MNLKSLLIIGLVSVAAQAEKITIDTIREDYKAAINAGNAYEAFYWQRKLEACDKEYQKLSYSQIQDQIKTTQTQKIESALSIRSDKKNNGRKKRSRSKVSLKDIIRKLQSK